MELHSVKPVFIAFIACFWCCWIGNYAAFMFIGKQQNNNILLQRRINWGLAILAGWLVITVVFAFKPLEALLGLKANFLPFFLIFLECYIP